MSVMIQGFKEVLVPELPRLLTYSAITLAIGAVIGVFCYWDAKRRGKR